MTQVIKINGIPITVSGDYLPLTGGTVSGGTTFLSGVTASTFYGAGILDITQSTSTGYTLSLSDSSNLVSLSAATFITITIPPNSGVTFPIGAQILFKQNGSGQLRFTGDTGVTLQSYGNAFNTAGQYATAFLTKEDADLWILDGTLTTQNI